MTGFDAGHAARRPLHRDRPGREGIEAELVQRLTAEIAPATARHALARCLEGVVTPPAALAQLVLACRNVAVVRELVDEVTARADEDSRAGDALVRDRADALTRLFVENSAACGRALARWTRCEAGETDLLDDLAAAAPVSAGDGSDAAVTSYYEAVFARVLREGAESA